MLELELLGSPRLHWENAPLDPPSPKPLAILGYLAACGAPRTRDELLELFWTNGKLSNVRFALHKLRELPGAEDWLATDGRLVSVRAHSDVAAFEEAVRDERFGDALDAWSGEGAGERTLLLGAELDDADGFSNWLEGERERLAALHLDALRGRLAELERNGDAEAALKLARALLERDPLDEAAHRAVMRLEHARGDTAAALAQFERCRRLLEEELEVEPLDATLELLREIERGGVSSGASAVLASSGDAIPARPETLVGRSDLVGDALEALEARSRVLLYGFGGVGKSALAAAVAETYLADAGDRVLWLHAGDDGPEALFGAVARALDGERGRSGSRADAARVRALLRERRPSLLVLDDVWNAYALGKLMEAVPGSVPLLITSRQRYPGLARLQVGPLTRDAALELLGHHAGADLHGDSDADALCRLLGDHAFALRIAGIQLRLDALTPAALIARVADAPHTLTLPAGAADEEHESVAALLGASLEALPEEPFEAFMAFGALASTRASPELLALCVRRGEEATEEALFTLQERGLAERVSEPGSDAVTYRVHDLAYSFARATSHVRPRTAERACELFLERHRSDFEVLDADVPNLLGAVRSASARGRDDYLVAMMRTLTVGEAYFGARGHTPRSLELLTSSVRAARELGEIETAHLLASKLGDAHRELHGDLELALAAFREALDLARQLGDPHREATVLTVIGIVRFHQGEDDADRYLDDAHRIAAEHADGLALCRVLEHKGCVAGLRGDLHAAHGFFRTSVEQAERLQDDPAADRFAVDYRLFFSLLNLGEVERLLGRFDGALELRTRALVIAEERDNQMWTAFALQEIGETYHGAGDRRRAREHYERALDLYRCNDARSDLATLEELMRGQGYGGAAADLPPSSARGVTAPLARSANARQTARRYRSEERSLGTLGKVEP